MFYRSDFNSDISKWSVSKVTDMSYMFYGTIFNQDISKWDVLNVKHMAYMFLCSKFNQNISNWKINKNCDTSGMFRDCSIKNEFKPKIK